MELKTLKDIRYELKIRRDKLQFTLDKEQRDFKYFENKIDSVSKLLKILKSEIEKIEEEL